MYMYNLILHINYVADKRGFRFNFFRGIIRPPLFDLFEIIVT